MPQISCLIKLLPFVHAQLMFDNLAKIGYFIKQRLRAWIVCLLVHESPVFAFLNGGETGSTGLEKHRLHTERLPARTNGRN
jgi:hypothetical protein